MKHPSTELPRGFTLVELLVSLAVASLLVVMVATITSSASSASALILDRLSAQQDAKVALDFFEKDFAGLAQTESARTTLTIVPETLPGRMESGSQQGLDPEDGAAEIKSFWIMMLSRPVGFSEQGALKGVSYKMVLWVVIKHVSSV